MFFVEQLALDRPIGSTCRTGVEPTRARVHAVVRASRLRRRLVIKRLGGIHIAERQRSQAFLECQGVAPLESLTR